MPRNSYRDQVLNGVKVGDHYYVRRFPVWFEEVTGLGFPHLAERCGATLKKGTRFDGWGSGGCEFLHRFQPARLIGYHFDATELVRVLGEHVRAKRVDARVEELHTSADGVEVRLAEASPVTGGLVFHVMQGIPRPRKRFRRR